MLRPYLVDTHCHLGDAAFDADRDAVLARARAAGVTHVVVIGESLAGSERAAALTRGTSGLSASAGVHPHEAREWSDTARERVRELLATPMPTWPRCYAPCSHVRLQSCCTASHPGTASGMRG